MKTILTILIIAAFMFYSCTSDKNPGKHNAIKDIRFTDTTVQQSISYIEGKYYLITTIETPEIYGWYYSHYMGMSGPPNNPYVKVISGTYTDIAQNKRIEYIKATYFLQKYKIQGKQDLLKRRAQAVIDSAINDSIKTLNQIKP